VEQKKHKRGDTREDGMVFWSRQPHMPNGEWWVTKDKFGKLKEKNLDATKNRRERLKKAFLEHPRIYTKGYTREDGMVFWEYFVGAKGFEYWLTPDKYKSRQEKRRSPERRRTERQYMRRRRLDPLVKFKDNLYCLIRNSISAQGFSKKSKTFETLGCTYGDFMDHIECQFEECMFFENYGEWQLDHILPMSAATTEEEVILLNHYTNFQPMWAAENKSKHDKHCPKALADYLENHPTKKPQAALRAIPAA